MPCLLYRLCDEHRHDERADDGALRHALGHPNALRLSSSVVGSRGMVVEERGAEEVDGRSGGSGAEGVTEVLN